MAGSWSKEETLKLIEIWGNDAIQAQLEGCKRNQEVFSRIAAEMSEAGFERTAQQCRDKIKKLKVEYRKIKDKRKRTGEGRYPEWDYFDALDAILGHKPATEPPVVINSLGTSVNDPQEQVPELDPPPSPELFDNDQPGTSGQAEGSRSTTPVLQQPRKRKRSKIEKIESVTGELINKFIEVQQNSDRLMIELEEKRLKFEERQMEKEAQQRREEREFQLRMMQMMMGQSVYGTPPSSMHMGPPSSASFAFGTMHESTLASRMHTFPSRADSDDEL